MTHYLSIFEPHPGLFAYYEGREDGHRFMTGPNWVDDGALSLGIASYALVSGTHALVYDTHVAPDRAQAIRDHLAAKGVTSFTVVLSHCHLDHVAGTAVFADCEIIANAKTLAHLTRDKAAIEAGTDSGLPVISPLILPTHTFSGRMDLTIGTRTVTLIEANIHSDDATVVWLAEDRILLAGDCVEDTVTYVGAPEDFAIHLTDLDRLAALNPSHILPCHGDPDVIAKGGYGPDLIQATKGYITWLITRAEPATPLREVIADDLASGALHWFDGYEAIHRQNVARYLAIKSKPNRLA